MAQTQPKRMSVAEFLDWEFAQEEKWELVDGVPARKRDRMMSGGTLFHGLISSRIIAALTPRLRGGECVPLTSDVRVESPKGVIRYPDATVDCGPRRGDDLIARGPRAIFEVLSPSNSLRQQLRLLDDYQSIESVQHIVFVSQQAFEAIVWTREAQGWRRDEVDGQEAELTLSALGFALPMAEIYEGVTFGA